MFLPCHLPASILLLVCLAICGCDSADVPSEPIPQVSAVSLAQTKSKKGKPADPSKAPTAEQKSGAGNSVATDTPQAAYEPPYPDRENLFLAPKRSLSIKSAGNREQAVELLGFANVQGQKVILSINGMVIPLSEGGQDSGIEVISIQPPSVVLQRDRERWQATLEY